MKPLDVNINPLASAELTLPRWVIKRLAKIGLRGLLPRQHTRIIFILLLMLLRTCSFIATGSIFIILSIVSHSSIEDIPDLVGHYLKCELSEWRYQLTYSILIDEWRQDVRNKSKGGMILSHIQHSKLIMESSWFSCKEWFMQRTRIAGVFQRR